MDILDCLANLSNDEVFTSPAIANRMLDTLPEALWSDPNAKFLDPFTKSGVFLREIAKRLMQGLATAIPDRQARLDHSSTALPLPSLRHSPQGVPFIVIKILPS